MPFVRTVDVSNQDRKTTLVLKLNTRLFFQFCINAIVPFLKSYPCKAIAFCFCQWYLLMFLAVIHWQTLCSSCIHFRQIVSLCCWVIVWLCTNPIYSSYCSPLYLSNSDIVIRGCVGGNLAFVSKQQVYQNWFVGIMVLRKLDKPNIALFIINTKTSLSSGLRSNIAVYLDIVKACISLSWGMSLNLQHFFEGAPSKKCGQSDSVKNWSVWAQWPPPPCRGATPYPHVRQG